MHESLTVIPYTNEYNLIFIKTHTYSMQGFTQCEVHIQTQGITNVTNELM